MKRLENHGVSKSHQEPRSSINGRHCCLASKTENLICNEKSKKGKSYTYATFAIIENTNILFDQKIIEQLQYLS